ncbi:MAG: DUF222 domain-containing protein [Cellulomonas sp.]
MSVPAELLSGVSTADLLEAIRVRVDALVQVRPRDLNGPEALAAFDGAFELSDRLQAFAVQALPVVEADVPWNLSGARTFPSWVAAHARVTYTRAKRLTRLGRALRDELPLTAAGVLVGGDGRVSVEQAEILTTAAATSAVRRAALVDPEVAGERFLLQQASLVGVDRLRLLARRWAAAADPDADERGYREVTEREFFDLSPTTGGHHLSGFLTTDHAEGLLVALHAVQGIPAAGDERTASQRRAGALSDLARLTLDHGLAGSGASVRPHISVLVDYPTLVALTTAAGGGDQVDPVVLNPAVYEDGQPVSRAALDKHMCDAEVSRFVFSTDSQLLNVSRSKRKFTGQLRRAIIARDKHCQYPHCTAPPPLCEGHHCQHWFRDHGNTDAREGMLLCWHHHEHVHDHGIEIAWKAGGGWQFTDRHGTLMPQ